MRKSINNTETDPEEGFIVETKPLIKKETPKIPFYNTDEYWSIYIGLFMFTIVTVLSVFGFNMPHASTWQKIGEMFGLEDFIGFPILVFLSVVIFNIQHLSTKKRQTFFFYLVIIALVLASIIIGNYHSIHNIGFGTSIWCIIFGILLRNLLEATSRFHSLKCVELQKSVLSYEMMIKISVVLLAIDMINMVEYGIKGMVVAWCETILIILIIFGIGYKLVGKDTSIVVACGVSVCGSSAATAISDAIASDKLVLAKFIAIMSILTIPTIPTLPVLSTTFNLTTTIEGAWIGGSVDSTGAVMAAANLGGSQVLHVAIVIKMLQNILIGPLALVVTGIWTKNRKLMILWDKFPKFVLGFILTSIVATLLPGKIKILTITNSFIISEWFSSISFVLIGFDINLMILKEFKEHWKMALLYVIGQSIDLCTTLGVAYLMFDIIS